MEQSRSSAEQVFAIPELMEMILLNLPIRQILHAQRISKDCEGTIKASKKLQQALFFEPFPMESLHPRTICKHSECVAACEAEIRKNRKSGLEYFKYWPGCTLILRNPFSGYLTYDTGIKPSASPRWLQDKGFVEQWRKTARNRPEASWRRMYLSQPAVEFECGELKFGELGDELTKVQKWLSDQSYPDGLRPVDYADELLSVFHGTLRTEPIKYDMSQKGVEDMRRADEIPGDSVLRPFLID